MSTLLQVQVITPKETVFDGTAVAVTLPAEAGEMQVYQGHIPVLGRVVPGGAVRIEMPGKDPMSFDVSEGFFRVTPEAVSILVDSLTMHR